MNNYKTEKELSLPSWDDMPDIGLYMDQVLVLMDKYLGNFLKIENKDSFITPSMINNYVKNNIMPAPESKRYSKSHLCYLIIICLMKQSLTISSIKKIIQKELEDKDIVYLYTTFCNIYSDMLNSILNNNDILLNDADNSSRILKIGIISSICRTICDKQIMEYSTCYKEKNEKK